MSLRFTVVVILALFAVAPARAQPLIPIGAQPSCGGCAIELQPVVRLGSINDPGGFGPLVEIAVNSRNEYFVSSSTFVGEIFVYGSDGQYRRSIGRRGEGPGEFSRPLLLAFDSRDSLHAIEGGGSKHSVFTPDLAFARATQLQSRILGFKLEPSGILFAVAPTSTPQVSEALQLFSREGNPLQSFDRMDPGAPGQFGRSIAIDSRGGRWSIANVGYRLKQWNQQGDLARELQGRREWVVEALPMRLDLTRERPPGQIGGIHADDDGLVWIYAVVADANWRPVEAGSQPEMSRLFDTVIEVIDPETGALVATARVDPVVLPIGGGKVYGMIEEASGDMRIQIWQVSLRGR